MSLRHPPESVRSTFLAAALFEFFAGSAWAGSVSAGGFDGETGFAFGQVDFEFWGFIAIRAGDPA